MHVALKTAILFASITSPVHAESSVGRLGQFSLEQIREYVYDYADLTDTLTTLNAVRGNVINVTVIGETAEGRDIYAVKLGVAAPTQAPKPALLAIFAQHSSEHSMTSLAVGLVEALSGRYGEDRRITALLDSVDVWILPMVNPDGVTYDLSGQVRPYSWRKNRRPTGPDTFGVDLNRNWTRPDTSSDRYPPELPGRSHDNYWGEEEFSEVETRSLRTFVVGHPNIRLFVDYHAGSGGFLQGVTGCWMPEHGVTAPTREFCASVVKPFAEAISDSLSGTPGFQVIDKPTDVLEVLKRFAPPQVSASLPDELPKISGLSTDYVSGEMGIAGIGVEMFRAGDYYRNAPDSQIAIMERHLNGILHLLEGLLGRM